MLQALIETCINILTLDIVVSSLYTGVLGNEYIFPLSYSGEGNRAMHM